MKFSRIWVKITISTLKFQEITGLLNSKINSMLARMSPPFHSDGYLYEVKWDGERIIAFAENGKIKRLQNRKGMDVSKEVCRKDL